MDWNEAIALVHGTDWKHAKIGLERMKTLLSLLGEPQKDMRYIHIAGTNGKGSASILSQSILSRAGYRTGRYISPHIDAFNERMSIDGEMISDAELREEAARVKAAISRMQEEPTDFEIITAMALDWFQRKQCDIVVLEVGMGGRLDATNVIEAPLCSVIMHIGLDHTEILGDTVTKIAKEKAGIIKKHCPVVVYHQDTEVLEVLKDAARECDSEMVVTSPENCRIEQEGLQEQIFSYRDRKHLKLQMLGSYQVENACAVLDLMDILKKKGFGIPETAIMEGLQDAIWPGRYERLHEEPTVILDGAHNPNGVEALVKALQKSFPGQTFLFVMGVMKDKDIPEMIEKTAPFAKEYIAEIPVRHYERTMQAERLREIMKAHFHGPVFSTDSVEEGLALAMEHALPQDVVVCFGSLYQVATIRKRFSKNRK